MAYTWTAELTSVAGHHDKRVSGHRRIVAVQLRLQDFPFRIGEAVNFFFRRNRRLLGVVKQHISDLRRRLQIFEGLA